jgi:hypothetical protein
VASRDWLLHWGYGGRHRFVTAVASIFLLKALPNGWRHKKKARRIRRLDALRISLRSRGNKIVFRNVGDADE